MDEERDLFSRLRDFSATLEEENNPPPSFASRSSITLTIECKQDINLE